ncbi:hypothetical protein BLS_004957 [Venturia inaequalis]|uniref:Uncharacterized protein n=1 Tax=Venturia inaequalis TaxID=5025 RepID=A0A8H3ZG14_VENIN|nr:hypothetical protein BLS_004957 [Venturia inaequalis]KAE9988167.1 hypothetical protein EG328_000123 [Venturia inaequalis]KAE9991902.1 hypothetical protein EG327_010689 [Venturia inaequalis]RDI83911.1 hypothetical protein Vi05172_g6008 [Venturia inaequalis]
MLSSALIKVFGVAIMAAGMVSASGLEDGKAGLIKRWADDPVAPVTVYSTVTITAQCAPAPPASTSGTPPPPATVTSATVVEPTTVVSSAPGSIIVTPPASGSTFVTLVPSTLSDGSLTTISSTVSLTTISNPVETSTNLSTLSGSITTFSAGSTTTKSGAVLGWLLFTMFAAI